MLQIFKCSEVFTYLHLNILQGIESSSLQYFPEVCYILQIIMSVFDVDLIL